MAAEREGDQVAQRQSTRAGEPAMAGRTKKPLGWKSAPFIFANETFEKVASYGGAADLTTYLVKRFYVRQLKATNITVFFATLNFNQLIGPFISDSYSGRFKTLASGCSTSLLVRLSLCQFRPRPRAPS